MAITKEVDGTCLESGFGVQDGDAALFAVFVERVKARSADGVPVDPDEVVATIFEEMPEFADLSADERTAWARRVYAVIQRYEEWEQSLDS